MPAFGALLPGCAVSAPLVGVVQEAKALTDICSMAAAGRWREPKHTTCSIAFGSACTAGKTTLAAFSSLTSLRGAPPEAAVGWWRSGVGLPLALVPFELLAHIGELIADAVQLSAAHLACGSGISDDTCGWARRRLGLCVRVRALQKEQLLHDSGVQRPCDPVHLEAGDGLARHAPGLLAGALVGDIPPEGSVCLSELVPGHAPVPSVGLAAVVVHQLFHPERVSLELEDARNVHCDPPCGAWLG